MIENNNEKYFLTKKKKERMDIAIMFKEKNPKLPLFA